MTSFEVRRQFVEGNTVRSIVDWEMAMPGLGRMTSAELLERARGGDERAFARLAEEPRTELQVHCYGIVGSVQDAEDLVQETLLAAWRGLDRFEGRATLRTWLYASRRTCR